MSEEQKDYKAITDRISEKVKEFHADIPEVMKGFGAMAKAATADGALDYKTKELIALAIGVACRCDPCIGFHAKTLVGLGATRAEIEEMLAVAVYMGGGPSLMYAADTLRAYEQFGGEMKK